MNRDYGRHPLSREGASILEAAGFRTELVALQQTGASVWVAEDVYTVAALIGADRWAQLADDLEDVTTDFVNWAFSSQPDAKQWDLYVCVLVAQPVTNDDELVQVEGFADDTRYVRRLVRHGIASEEAGPLHTALAALLPLELPERIAQRDPSGALVGALRGRGVDGDLAQQTVEQFLKATGIDP